MFPQLTAFQTLAGTLLVSCLCSMLLGPVVIPWLKRLKFGQQIRGDGPQTHLVKNGVPTMGGMMIVAGFFAGTLVFMRPPYDFVVPVLAVTLAYCVLGFLDDYISIRRKRSMGLTPRQKLVGQVGVAVLFAVYAFRHPAVGSAILIPFAHTSWDLWYFYLPFAVFVMVAFSNATNLTDGLDGLLASVTTVVAGTLALLFMSAVGSVALESMYADPGFAGQHNLLVMAAALAGGCLGYLKHNAHPAKVIMGDTGSLAIGGALSAMALLYRIPLFLAMVGLIYVIENVSVIMQVSYFKITHGKRIFKMAPIHHHFELSGMHEVQIVTMFLLVTLGLALVTLLAW